MVVMKIKKVEEFFEVNGLDVLSAKSIPTRLNIKGEEYSHIMDVYNYFSKTSFSGLWGDLVAFVGVHNYDWSDNFKK